MKKDVWLYGVAVVAGIAVWVVVSTVAHRREAWDSKWYFLVGMPVVCVISAVLGFVGVQKRPAEKAWPAEKGSPAEKAAEKGSG